MTEPQSLGTDQRRSSELPPPLTGEHSGAAMSGSPVAPPRPAAPPPPPPPSNSGNTGYTPGNTPGRQPRRWGCCLLVVLLVVLPAAILAALGLGVTVGMGDTLSNRTALRGNRPLRRITEEVMIPARGGSSRKIAVIDIKGIIASAGPLDAADTQRIAYELQAAREDPAVAAIVLDMNTPGGEVTASDELYQEVLRCREAHRPVVTCMRSMGASGGYFVAAGSDWIVANRMTMTGSVGVIISTLNYRELFAKIGLDSEVYRSGDMKDMLNGSRPRTNEESLYVQKMVDETFYEFAAVVAAGRERYENAEDVIDSPFGDGRILSGTDAYSLGLIDQVGYFVDAVNKARELADAADAKVVRYKRSVRFRDILMSLKAPESMELSSLLPQDVRCLQPGRLYFLAPTVVP